MKLKEVCEATGLSRKTIRLYEEKGLLAPRKERRNGRDFREYTEADVEQLCVIASLRRAWFTMEEIRRMQEDPAVIREIFPQYKEWLHAQKQQLDGLIAAAEGIELLEIQSVAQLSDSMEHETRKLPLPTMDVRPRFRYLDALEEPPRTIDPIIQGGTNMKFNDITKSDIIDQTHKDRTYRQFVASSSKDKHDDLAVSFGQFNEAVAAFKTGSDGPVDREPEKDPLLLRPILAILMLVAIWSGAASILSALTFYFDWRLWLTFVVSAGLRGGYAYWKYRKAQNAWIERMNQEKK